MAKIEKEQNDKRVSTLSQARSKKNVFCNYLQKPWSLTDMRDHERSRHLHSPITKHCEITLDLGSLQSDRHLRFQRSDVKRVSKKQFQRLNHLHWYWCAGFWLHLVPTCHEGLQERNLLAKLLHGQCWRHTEKGQASNRILSCLHSKRLH